MSRLQANDFPISGVEILQGEELDMLSFKVRLPPGLNFLTPQIIKQFERENKEATSRKQPLRP